MDYDNDERGYDGEYNDIYVDDRENDRDDRGDDDGDDNEIEEDYNEVEDNDVEKDDDIEEKEDNIQETATFQTQDYYGGGQMKSELEKKLMYLTETKEDIFKINMLKSLETIDKLIRMYDKDLTANNILRRFTDEIEPKIKNDYLYLKNTKLILYSILYLQLEKDDKIKRMKKDNKKFEDKKREYVHMEIYLTDIYDITNRRIKDTDFIRYLRYIKRFIK